MAVSGNWQQRSHLLSKHATPFNDIVIAFVFYNLHPRMSWFFSYIFLDNKKMGNNSFRRTFQQEAVKVTVQDHLCTQVSSEKRPIIVIYKEI